MPKTIKVDAPTGVPRKVALAFFSGDAPETVELKIKVSALDRVKRYGFAYDRIPVPISVGNGEGVFYAVKGQKKLLEWIIEGDAGGGMKVKVTRGSETVDEREKTTVPAGYSYTYDGFEIMVA